MKSLKPTLLLIISLLVQVCMAQVVPKQKFFDESLKWSITIPEGFESVPAKEWSKIQNRGAQAIEDTYEEEVINLTEIIFVFRAGQFNIFESNTQPFDEELFENYEAACAETYSIVYETFTAQMPDAQVDTLTSTEVIDNLEFQKFEVKIQYPNGLVMHIFMFSRLFDDREFTVNLMYIDEEQGEKMMEAWQKSTFKKEK